MNVEEAPTALVFGGFGTVGTAVSTALAERGLNVLRTSRWAKEEANAIQVNIDGPRGPAHLANVPPVDAVVWAQGVTTEDSIKDFDDRRLATVMRSNCSFVAITLSELLKHERLREHCRMCVISSIWEQRARPDKFSYTISKAALGGLVRSVAIDLADRDILINAVLPGVIEGPMAQRPNSSAESFTGWTAHERLVKPSAVAELVAFLCSQSNVATTGQSIPVDYGALTTLMRRDESIN